MHAVVTGATGYIGQHLVTALLKAKHTVTVAVRDQVRAEQLFGQKVTIVAFDLTRPTTFKNLPTRYDILFHLAAAVSYRFPSDKEFFNVNVTGTKQFISYLKKNFSGKKIVAVSSVGVYGPIIYPPATEQTPHHPENVYEQTKDRAEQLFLRASVAGLPVTILQPTLVYGPGDTASGMFRFFQSVASRKFLVIGSHPPLLHLAYIDTVIAALLAAAKSGHTGEVVIVGDAKPWPLNTLATNIAAAYGVRLVPFRLPLLLAHALGLLGDALAAVGFPFPLSSATVTFMTNHRAYDVSKLTKELRVTPVVSTKQGIVKTVRWYQENL